MFSRSGRFTNAQYLNLNPKHRTGHANDSPSKGNRDDDDDDEADQADIGMMMGEKPRDIAQEM